MNKEKRLRKLYCDDGLSLMEVAKKLGTTYYGVRKLLIENNIPFRLCTRYKTGTPKYFRQRNKL